MWARAKFAATFLRLGLAHRASEASAGEPGPHGPATSTAPKSRPDGCNTLAPELQAKLERRAMSINNRNRELAQRYMRRHLVLARGH